MATAENHSEESDKKGKPKSSLMLWIVIAILAVGGGLAAPLLAAKFLGGSSSETEEDEHGEESDSDSEGHEAAGHESGSSGQSGGGHGGDHGGGHGGDSKKVVAKHGKIKFPKPSKIPAFIDFEEIIVNLDESRFNRYLKIVFSMQVAENHRGDIESLIEGKKAILKNWLISHLADKSLDDIKGKFGHSRLRREISDYFNQVLFEDGVERIQDILFKELNVQ